MLPDEYLAKNVAVEAPGVEVIAGTGRCEVHEQFTPQDIRDLRVNHPGVVVLAHPECPPEMVAQADFAGSTAAIVRDVGRAWIGCPSIGFDGCALSQVGGDKTVQRGGGKVLDCCEANAAGRAVGDFDRAVGDFDRAGDEHFALGRAPAAARDRIVLAAQGDFCLVDLGDPSQERAGRRDHGPPQLGAQQPSRLMGAQRKQPLQLQRRNSVGVGGHQIGGPEPDGQRTFSEFGFRDEVADALHNDPMGPPELHTLQLPGAQEFIHSAPTDIEHVGSAIDSNGQAIVEIDEVNVTTFAHARKMATSSILKKKAPTNWCGDFSEVIFCRNRATV